MLQESPSVVLTASIAACAAMALVMIGAFIVRPILALIGGQKTPAGGPVPVAEPDPIERQTGVIEGTLEVLNKDAWRRHEKLLAALDSIAHSMDQLSTSQKAFLRAMLGETVIPAHEEPDEDPAVEEAARKLLRRYGNGITREEALERARETLVYRGSRGMGASA